MQRIARLCVTDGIERIVEIGAGTGALTAGLLALGGRVYALEIDRDLVAILAGRADLRGATIIEADALEFSYGALTGAEPWCACGNLPYNIATPLVLRWLELADPPARIVVMVQKDVGDRFVAKPSTPAYGSLSLALQITMDVRRAFVLRPSAFYPRPRIDSTVVVMESRTDPIVPASDRSRVLQVVRSAFAYRRKTLANSLELAAGIARPRTQDALQQLGLSPEIRAEQLDLGAFAALADRLVERS